MFLTKKKEEKIREDVYRALEGSGLIRGYCLFRHVGDSVYPTWNTEDLSRIRMYGALQIEGIPEKVDNLKEENSRIEAKLDLLIDHLGLEYHPERKCGPTLEPKQKEDGKE